MKSIRKVLCMVMAVGTVLAAGCGKDKVAVDPETFISTLEGAGATVSDQTESMEDISSATNVQVAYVDDQYKIEYYVFDEETDAGYLFGASKSELETAAESASGVAKTSVSAGNHAKYTISMGGNYIAVSRIGNTVMYATAAGDYKEVVKDLMDEMGY